MSALFLPPSYNHSHKMLPIIYPYNTVIFTSRPRASHASWS